MHFDSFFSLQPVLFFFFNESPAAARNEPPFPTCLCEQDVTRHFPLLRKGNSKRLSPKSCSSAQGCVATLPQLSPLWRPRTALRKRPESCSSCLLLAPVGYLVAASRFGKGHHKIRGVFLLLFLAIKLGGLVLNRTPQGNLKRANLRP